MEDRNFSAELQGQVSRFKGDLLRTGFSRPLARCVSDVLFALLKCRHVHVTALAQALGERISLKKTWERLRRGLARPGLWRRLLDAHLSRHAAAIRRMRYCILDVSDVQKPYARKQEGLARVRDGSRSRGKQQVIGMGYWWVNAVMSDGTDLLPVHSELFSVTQEAHDHQSENRKLVEMATRMHQRNPEGIAVIDRGGDRGTIIEPLFAAGVPFIIRGMSLRNLRLHADAATETNIETIARRVRPTEDYTLRREGRHGRGKTIVFRVGIRRVYLGGRALWLVVCHRHGGGMSWFLTTVVGSRFAVMDTVLEGYGERWRIEEIHRQLKQDFHFERIAVRDYGSLKALGVLVMLAEAFLMQMPAAVRHLMMAVSNVLPRKRITDVPHYPFYLLSAAVAKLLAAAGKRPPTPLWLRRRDDAQLKLDLVLAA